MSPWRGKLPINERIFKIRLVDSEIISKNLQADKLIPPLYNINIFLMYLYIKRQNYSLFTKVITGNTEQIL